jgi:ribosome-associated protein
LPTKPAPQRKAKAKSSSVSDVPLQLRTLIEKSLDDDKAEDIISYDLVGQTSLTDYMIIASGKSARQISAMAEHLRELLEGSGKKPVIEGLEQGDWVLVDVGDVIVHLFRPEVRNFYQLEKLWGPVATSSSDELSPAH